MGPTGGNMPHGQDAGFLVKLTTLRAQRRSVKKRFQVPDLMPPRRNRRIPYFQRAVELRNVVA